MGKKEYLLYDASHIQNKGLALILLIIIAFYVDRKSVSSRSSEFILGKILQFMPLFGKR